MQLPDPEALIALGQAARELLESEAFTATVNDISNYHLAALVAAPPGAKGLEAREHHHLLHFALSEIVGELQSRVSTADEMLELIARGEKDD